jgi:hypothetical protein
MSYNNDSHRQTLIVRQSQMERAIEYYQLIGVEPTVIELLATADHFAQFVENGITKEIVEKTKKVDAFIQHKQDLKKEDEKVYV